MNANKYVGSLPVTASDAGSTPAASTIFFLYFFFAPTKVPARPPDTFELAFPQQIAVHVSVQHFNRTMPQGERSMTVHDRVRAVTALIALPGLVLCVATCLAQAPPQAQYSALPSETPAKFQAVTDSFDYVRREATIPMRDGVKLHTVILVPKGATHAPILLTRTPYNADRLTGHAQSSHLAPILDGYDNATDVIVDGGYIRVVQDVRGKYGSEGDYVMNRPLHGPQNPTPVDMRPTHTTQSIGW